MPTRCNLTVIDFGRASGRQVVADFDGGMVSSDAGALLLRDGQGHRVGSRLASPTAAIR